MTSKIVGIIAFCVLIVSTSIGYFCDFATADIISIAGAFFGAGTIAVNALAKKENKTWKTYFVVIGSALAGLLCCFGGFSENLISSIVGGAIAIVTIGAGIITEKKS